MKHSDCITHINNEEDEVFLRSRLLPVNMRLFKTSPQYRDIILSMCEYIKESCLTTREGYKKPHGMSAANLALGHNIIGITTNRNTPEEDCLIMINPVIVWESSDRVLASSNCGSLTLEEPIQVPRRSKVGLIWFDTDGQKQERKFDRASGSFSLQHEVQHNLGILITEIWWWYEEDK